MRGATMHSKLAVALSAAALVIATLGTTPVGQALGGGGAAGTSTTLLLTKIRGYEIVSRASEFDSSPYKSVVAECSRGKKVLGGGAISTGNAAVFHSVPIAGGEGWAAAFQEVGPFEPAWFATVYAICAIVDTGRTAEG